MQTIDHAKLKKEVNDNFKKFDSMHFDLSQKGKFALMRHGEVVEIMADRFDAVKLAKHIFEDGIYSVQEIHPEPITLGFRSYALRHNEF